MSGDSQTRAHNRLSVLLGSQFLVLLLRTYVAFIQIIMLFFPDEIRINGFGVLFVPLLPPIPLLSLSFGFRISRANYKQKSCIFANFLGDVILLVMILVEMHKRAVGTLDGEWFYKLEIAKTAWVVGGWVVLLRVYRGHLVMMAVDWRVWSSLVVDLIYL